MNAAGLALPRKVDRDLLYATHPRNRAKQNLPVPVGAWSARHPAGVPHRPDLGFVLADGRAVEVECSAKTVAGYEGILTAYASSGFAGVHDWTATTTIATRITTARQRIGLPGLYLATAPLP